MRRKRLVMIRGKLVEVWEDRGSARAGGSSTAVRRPPGGRAIEPVPTQPREVEVSSHFFGGLTGEKGEATRMGTKNSGLTTFSETRRARVTTFMVHHAAAGPEQIAHDEAIITLSGGRETRRRLHSLSFEHIEDVTDALDFDERAQASWAYIQQQVAKLDGIAVRAMEKKRKQDAKDTAEKMRALQSAGF